MEDRTAPAGNLRARSKVLASPLPTAGGTAQRSQPQGERGKEGAGKGGGNECSHRKAKSLVERRALHHVLEALARLLQEAEARKARRAVKAAIAISADPTLQAPELKMIWGDFRCRSWPHHSFPVVPRSVQRSAWGCRLLCLVRSSSRIVGIGQRPCQNNTAEATTTDTASGSQESWIQSACSSMYGSSAGGRALCECPLVAAACIMLGCRQFALLPAALRGWPIRARACMHQPHALQK